MKKDLIVKLFSVVCLSLFMTTQTGCMIVVKRPPRPAAKAEVRPAAPGPQAVWVAGHWQWKGGPRHGQWVWIPGHWKRR